MTQITENKKNLIVLIAAFAAVYVFWGSTYLAIKYTIETLPPIAGALSWAAGSIYGLKATTPRSSLLTAGMQMLAGSASLLVVGLLRGEHTRSTRRRFRATRSSHCFT